MIQLINKIHSIGNRIILGQDAEIIAPQSIPLLELKSRTLSWGYDITLLILLHTVLFLSHIKRSGRKGFTGHELREEMKDIWGDSLFLLIANTTIVLGGHFYKSFNLDQKIDNTEKELRRIKIEPKGP